MRKNTRGERGEEEYERHNRGLNDCSMRVCMCNRYNIYSTGEKYTLYSLRSARECAHLV
jgi:hypothetical protein